MPRKHVLVALAVAAVALGGAITVAARPSSGAERVRDLIDWDESCQVAIERPLRGDGSRWRHTDDAALVVCEAAGPAVMYVRFASVGDRDREMARVPELGEANCVKGREVLLDSLFGGFAQVCRRFGGTLHPAPPR